jgi:excisionase family DNA binding protein
MLTVPEAARRVRRDPETVRRWIRTGKLRTRRIGHQHFIEEADLAAVQGDGYEMLPVPRSWGWGRTLTGEPLPNSVEAIRRSREAH